MGPGPSDVHPRVLQAMARPTIGHMDPEFIESEKRHVLPKRPENGSRLNAPFGAVPLRHSRGLSPRGDA